MDYKVMLKKDYDILLKKIDALAPGWFIMCEKDDIKYINYKRVYNCAIDKVVNLTGYSARVKENLNNNMQVYYDLKEIKRIYESIKSTEELGVTFSCKEDFDIWCSNMLVWGSEYIEVVDEVEDMLMKISTIFEEIFVVQNGSILKQNLLDFLLFGSFLHLNYYLNRVYFITDINCNFVEATLENVSSIVVKNFS